MKYERAGEKNCEMSSLYLLMPSSSWWPVTYSFLLQNNIYCETIKKKKSDFSKGQYNGIKSIKSIRLASWDRNDKRLRYRIRTMISHYWQFPPEMNYRSREHMAMRNISHKSHHLCLNDMACNCFPLLDSR